MEAMKLVKIEIVGGTLCGTWAASARRLSVRRRGTKSIKSSETGHYYVL